MIGIKLDKWFPNGCDGIVENKKLMDIKPGFGYFLTQQQIQLLNFKREINQQEYPTRIFHLMYIEWEQIRGKLCKIIDYVKETRQCKVLIFGYSIQ